MSTGSPVSASGAQKNPASGYRRITVERPLQLRIDPQNPEKRAALAADSAWEKLDPDEKGLFLEVLDTLQKSYLFRLAQVLLQGVEMS